jgi:hypothetical protein
MQPCVPESQLLDPHLDHVQRIRGVDQTCHLQGIFVGLGYQADDLKKEWLAGSRRPEDERQVLMQQLPRRVGWQPKKI